MMESEENKKFEQVAQKIEPQSKLLRAWELKGGISARVTALEIERRDGQTRKMVVRQHSAVDLAHNPQIAADEIIEKNMREGHRWFIAQAFAKLSVQ
jgi:hypothetical protein